MRRNSTIALLNVENYINTEDNIHLIENPNLITRVKI